MGFGLAAAIGFLIGRTREDDPAEDGLTKGRKPGIRDFIIIAWSGGLAALLQNSLLTVALLVTIAALLLGFRWQQPRRNGVTSELAALATFVLGLACLSHLREFAAAIGIALAVLLNAKKQLHAFALQTISEREFTDTLKFLALIFVIYPILPSGAFGSHNELEPRKIWLFVIVLSSVSYFGYFLTKFAGPRLGMTFSALLGGLASTTAYTGGISRAVAEVPSSAAAMARAVVLANSIQYPRLFFILLVLAPTLALESAGFLSAMFLAGLLAALLTSGEKFGTPAGNGLAVLKNPFSLRPALEFGVVFMLVLGLSRYIQAVAGHQVQMVASFIGGLVDVDAVSLTQADAVRSGQLSPRPALWGIYFATAGNAFFKMTLAAMSRQPGFFLRVAAGFVLMLAAGLAVLLLIS